MRKVNALLLLLAASPASAWEVVEGEPIVAPGEVTGLLAAPMGARDVAIALGVAESWIIDPLHGEVVRTLDRGGLDAVLVDIDGDERAELVGCGETGLWSVPWTGRYGGDSTDHDLRACQALTVVESGDYAGIVAAGDGWIRHFQIDEGVLTPGEQKLFRARQGRPLLQAEGDAIAYSVVGADEISVLGALGESTIATGGAIGDLAWARGSWSWTLPQVFSVADQFDRRTPLPDARLLVAWGDDLLVVGDGVSSFLSGDESSALSTPVGLMSAAGADLDSDGCLDLLFSDGSSVRALEGVCEGQAATGTPAPERYDEPDDGPRLRNPKLKRRRLVLGVEVPSFLGNQQVGEFERGGKQGYLVVGSGWAMGATIGPVDVQIPFFPALALGYELGGPHARFFIGADSAALFFWLRSDGQSGGIHLANVTMGATFGSPALRVGPFLTGGLLNYGAGLRTVLTPWSAGGSSKGIETRLTVFGPSTGEVMILYVWSQPLKKSRGFEAVEDKPTKRADEYPELSRISIRAEPPTRKALPVCGRFSVGAGAAVSVSSTVFSWTHVGADTPVGFGGSPVIALGCDSGFERAPVSLFIGMETAPFLQYLLFNGGNAATDRLSHFGTFTGGLMVGGKGFSAGPIGVAGIWELGAGARTVIGLHTDKQGLRHHLELRAYGLYKGAPAGEAFLMYGFSWDPWKDASFGSPNLDEI